MTSNPATPSLPRDPQAERWPHASVLVVDDEVGMRNFLVKALQPRCANVVCAASAEEADALLRVQRFDLVVLDITLPGKSGIAWLRELREQGVACEAVLITAFADLDTAIEALRAGASDFILKPFRLSQILNAVQHCLERSRLTRENYVLKRTLSERLPAAPDALVGRSQSIRVLVEQLQRVAAVDSTVLLTGESGTGKGLAAQALHRDSPRAPGPFVTVNCATLSPELLERELFGHAKGAFPGATKARDGLFYYAQGGTLFFDEVGELPPALQTQLLRVLDDGSFRPLGSEQRIAADVRIVAATSRPLAHDAAAERFRKDLYYRLQVVEIGLPPLREHLDDIDDLAAHFNATLARQLGVQPIELGFEDLAYLRRYAWPGNVRELRNLIERSLILGSLNVSALYPGRPAPADVAATPLHELEKRHILAVLESVAGDKTHAARLLGVSRRTLERRVAEWAGGSA